MPSLHDEADLERALFFLYRQWELLGYRAVEFYEMFAPCCRGYKGGILAVQAVLRENEIGGFEFLKKRRKLSLSVENLVLRPRWAYLFTEADRRLAQQKLGETQPECDRIWVSTKPNTPEFQSCAVEVRGTGTEFKQNVEKIKHDLAREGWEFIKLSHPRNSVPTLLFRRPISL